MKITQKEFEEVGAAYPLSHPARASIIKFLKKEKKAYITQIAKALELNERLISFHLSVLSKGGFAESEYGLSNPSTNHPRAVRYYHLTEKVDKTLNEFLAALK